MSYSLIRSATSPLRRYLDASFEALGSRIDEGIAAVREDTSAAARRTDPLQSVDVSSINAGSTPPRFDSVVSQVVSATQFDHPEFQRIAQLLTSSSSALPWHRDAWPLGPLHRKLWEYCFFLKAAQQHGKLTPGTDAVGFGVGREPIPAALARAGVRVLATDVQHEHFRASEWVATGQHMDSLESLSRPQIVSDAELTRLVSVASVDMTDLPHDLGMFDLQWSSSSMEHLGSPEAGLDFVVRAAEHLRPGGLAVHTTELELTRRAATADYGHLAVYRMEDIARLSEELSERGCEMPVNLFVALETPEDRWICTPPFGDHDLAHLKLVVGDSVSTSVGIIVRKST